MSETEPYNGEKIYSSISRQAHHISDRARDRSITIKAGYEGMCFQCQNAFIFRSSRNNDPTIICEEAPLSHKVMALDIRECNRYSKIGEIDLYDLLRTTPVVDLGTPTIKVGFEPEKKVDDAQ